MPLFGLPALWAGLSGATKLSMIGGVAGAALDQRNRNRDEYLNSPKGIREQAEAAGFDPLLFTGAAGSFGAGYAPTMGSKISTAFTLAGDQQQRELELKLQKTELEQENARLTAMQRNTTLTNNRGGIFDGPTYGNGNPARDSQGNHLSANDASGDGLGADRRSGAAQPTDYVKAEAPYLRIYKDWYGSGYLPSGQAVEDVIGDGLPQDIVKAPLMPLLFGDMVGYTLGNDYSQYVADRTYSFRNNGDLYALQPKDEYRPFSLGGWIPSGNPHEGTYRPSRLATDVLPKLRDLSKPAQDALMNFLSYGQSTPSLHNPPAWAR